MHCSIYHSSKKDGMYLYVCRPVQAENSTAFDPLDILPEIMRSAFGKARFVMDLELGPNRKLARSNVLHVMDSIQTKGFYLQMPPEGFIDPSDIPEGLRGA